MSTSHATKSARKGMGALRLLAAAVAAISADAGLAGSWQGRLALALLAPALARTSSLGAHYRVDSRAKHNIRRGIETPAYGEIA